MSAEMRAGRYQDAQLRDVERTNAASDKKDIAAAVASAVVSGIETSKLNERTRLFKPTDLVDIGSQSDCNLRQLRLDSGASAKNGEYLDKHFELLYNYIRAVAISMPHFADEAIKELKAERKRQQDELQNANRYGRLQMRPSKKPMSA